MKSVRVYEVPDGVSTLAICPDCHGGIGQTQGCENCQTFRMLLVAQANGRRLEVVDDPDGE